MAEVEAAAASAGFQLQLCRSAVGCVQAVDLLGMNLTLLAFSIHSRVLVGGNIEVFVSSGPTLAK